jgi:hypothetical protein
MVEMKLLAQQRELQVLILFLLLIMEAKLLNSTSYISLLVNMTLLNFISDLLSGSMIRFYFFGYGLHDPELQYGIAHHSCSLLYTDIKVN